MPARLGVSRRRLDGIAVVDVDGDAGSDTLEGERPGLVRRVSRTSAT